MTRPRENFCTICNRRVHFEDFLGCWIHSHDEGVDHNVLTPEIKIDFYGVGGPWTARDSGRRWNGFLVPLVTPETREQIAAFVAEMNGPEERDADAALAAEMRALPEGEDGLIEINLGLVFYACDVDIDPRITALVAEHRDRLRAIVDTDVDAWADACFDLDTTFADAAVLATVPEEVLAIASADADPDEPAEIVRWVVAHLCVNG